MFGIIERMRTDNPEYYNDLEKKGMPDFAYECAARGVRYFLFRMKIMRITSYDGIQTLQLAGLIALFDDNNVERAGDIFTGIILYGLGCYNTDRALEIYKTMVKSNVPQVIMRMREALLIYIDFAKEGRDKEKVRRVLKKNDRAIKKNIAKLRLNYVFYEYINEVEKGKRKIKFGLLIAKRIITAGAAAWLIERTVVFIMGGF